MDPNTNMFQASKEWISDVHMCDILPLEDVVQPCPLVPKFGTAVAALKVRVSQEIDMHNALEILDNCSINLFHSKSTYQTVF